MRAREAREVCVRAHDVELEGVLTLPPRSSGVVLFAHGSGSSRHSPRNRYVAGVLEQAGLGTLLFDLLTRREEAVDLATRHLRFDIPLLARRVVGAIDWIKNEVPLAPIGLFGASTGAAAALVAAARRPERVAAVVSRGGRPDLAGESLAHVRAPTLLVVGSLDTVVIGLNRDAMARMHAPVRLELVPGASHLFEEPGTLEQVASLAASFFRAHLRALRAHPEAP
ncbi:MAG: dienelactone hydrolase family protein [Sandaracinaceae bacterium]|nr:dienelactone hydrolase family protein [Sandaracinaceae bacterium]